MQSAADICAAKGRRKLVMLTCYDYSFARLLNARVDMLLVGDSLGNVILGYPRTTHVTLQDMIRHTAAVRRGAPDTFLIADLPAGSYDDPETAVKSARLLAEAGADAVKPEGRPDIVSALSSAGFSVMGHLGYLPQSEKSFRVVGRDEDEAERIIADAQAVQTAGAFSLVLECLPLHLAARITSRLTIPTIGIGAGPHCDGQVLVLYDLLGLFTDFQPKFVRRYADLASVVAEAIDRFVSDVKQGNFPNKKEEYR